MRPIGPSIPFTPPKPPAVAAHGDPFVGTCSLVTARMFLFDLSERLFAPREKLLAQRYRDRISERLAKLLPSDVMLEPA